MTLHSKINPKAKRWPTHSSKVQVKLNHSFKKSDSPLYHHYTLREKNKSSLFSFLCVVFPLSLTSIVFLLSSSKDTRLPHLNTSHHQEPSKELLGVSKRPGFWDKRGLEWVVFGLLGRLRTRFYKCRSCSLAWRKVGTQAPLLYALKVYDLIAILGFWSSIFYGFLRLEVDYLLIEHKDKMSRIVKNSRRRRLSEISHNVDLLLKLGCELVLLAFYKLWSLQIVSTNISLR